MNRRHCSGPPAVVLTVPVVLTVLTVPAVVAVRCREDEDDDPPPHPPMRHRQAHISTRADAL